MQGVLVTLPGLVLELEEPVPRELLVVAKLGDELDSPTDKLSVELALKDEDPDETGDELSSSEVLGISELEAELLDEAVTGELSVV